MSSRRGGKLPSTGASDASSKGNAVSGKSNPGVDKLSQGMAGVSLDAGQDDGWEVFSKKSKNKAGNGSGKQWAAQSSTSKAWGNPDTSQKLGLHRNSGSSKGTANAWPTMPTESKRPAALAPAIIPPPLKSGWGWAARAQSAQSSDGSSIKDTVEIVHPQYPEYSEDDEKDEKDEDKDEEEDEDDVLDDSDDGFMSDDYDSDVSVKSHETRTKSRWFKELFECMSKLTVEEINDPERQWHCPACKGGPGAIDWYKGLQPLITHAKTKGNVRVKLHRELATLLDEELRRRGTSAVPAGEIFGMWKGLSGVEKEIVWPPMVIIMNTRLDKDDNDKWIGMGNQELLEYFRDYSPEKARHSYGPQGHRGMSVLIFEASAVGYLAAESLSKDFEEKGRDRIAWDSRRVAFYPGEGRQLYGYFAEKKDMDFFNQHCQGKSKLKFELRSYQETVVSQLKQMSEENQQLVWLRNKIMKEKQQKLALEQSYGIVSERLRKTAEENRVIREKTKSHHEQNIEAMEYQEQFFQDQLRIVHEARKEKEETFEKLQQEELRKMKHSVEGGRCRAVEIGEAVKSQDLEIVAAKEKLLKAHEEKMLELKSRHWAEEVALEQEYNAELSKLVEKHTLGHP